jgi:hypothetical protein
MTWSSGVSRISGSRAYLSPDFESVGRKVGGCQARAGEARVVSDYKMMHIMQSSILTCKMQVRL